MQGLVDAILEMCPQLSRKEPDHKRLELRYVKLTGQVFLVMLVDK